MKLVRYNPFNELSLWNNSFNEIFNNAIPSRQTSSLWHPVVDIVDKEDNVVLNVEIPGIDKNDISVNIEDKVLTISGERKFEKKEEKDNFYKTERSYGKFKRAFTLSDDIVTDEVNAEYKDGILIITLKKDKTKEEVKQITIN